MKSFLIGLDAFDPGRFESLLGQGQLPHFEAFLKDGHYRRLVVSNPPQSEVSWTSIATGLNPGGHGMFDFVHRDPASYALYPSLLPLKGGPLGPQFTPPHAARTLFDAALEEGYPATALWWPAGFPARPASPLRSIPGLGTPDIHGQFGVGTLLTADLPAAAAIQKTTLAALEPAAGGFRGRLPGPRRKNGEQPWLAVELTPQGGQVALTVGKNRFTLAPGQWSPVMELAFPGGLLGGVRCVTRAIVRLTPAPQVYFLPLQLHPLASPWPYAAPADFIRRVWKRRGPFLTLGWPQDTTGLDQGILNDGEFLALCDDILATRERILLDELADFGEGVLASVFDTLDRVQHMFWRDQPEVVDAWYRKLDALLGRLRAAAPPDARTVIVSDHGFSAYDHKVHLNRWLLGRGYLAAPPAATDLAAADWPRTRAYALGLNSLYLNVRGREGQGVVEPADEAALLESLTRDLLAWRGPDGRAVVASVATRAETLHGPLAALGPDLLIGYAPGYRASSETGQGQWGAAELEPNRDHWGADHCIDPAAVPGVVLANAGLADLPHPSYLDLPELVLARRFAPRPGPPPAGLAADQQAIEDRLKGLGYL